ncbi:MAG: hypothetical protein M3Z26_08165 [Bacteroidota bacterium]|nr:hypothetical protein [Bacteroidota bacterium]
MKKDLKVMIDGKEYAIKYEKTGNRFDVIVEDNEIQKYIPSSFFLRNDHVEFLSTSDKTEKILNQIVKEINKHEK